MFEHDEIATFDGPEDMVEKCEYYLKHREEREAMAAKARARVLATCTYKHRAESLVQMITDMRTKRIN